MDRTGTKAVVITGCSSGIGYASVARMIEAGWQVFATVRKTADADRLRSEFGLRVTPLTLDVTDRASITAAAQQVSLELQGRGLDGLVNVAGIGMARPVEYIAEDDLREIFDINVFGQLAVTRAFLPLLRRARGRIVNITSVGAHIAVPFGSLINASKSAFAMFSDTLRMELHPFGIHVVAIEPGAIRTPAVEKTLGNMEAVTASLPQEGAAAYGPMLRNFAGRAYEREMNGSSPDVVARAVRRALTARRPRTRYVVGKHARVLTTLPKVLPDRVLDQLLLRIAGMPTGFGSLAEADEQKRESVQLSPAATDSHR
ncbi:MAG TPA: SDR family oxidoreductase [Candidatus Angelobacter sp.]|nr:SDR family oxidoreductase [Candidatus Angelobacter sp.]